MAPLRVGVTGLRAGQGATGLALSLAWSSARDRPTLLLDIDGAGGTVGDILAIDDRRCLQNVYSPRGVERADLERQAIAVAGERRLRVVLGFRGPGPSGAAIAPLLVPTLSEMEDELAVLDLGTPLAYPELVHRERAVQAIAEACHSVLVVVRTEDDLLGHAIRTLSTTHIPRARLVLVRPPHRRGADEAIALLREKLPAYPVATEWEWNTERWVEARARREPVIRDGLAEQLGFFGDGQITEGATPRRRLRWFRRAANDA